jgi:hypothetical protein
MPDKHKNVLELMTEMLHEQESSRYGLMNNRDLNEEKANGDHSEFSANVCFLIAFFSIKAAFF